MDWIIGRALLLGRHFREYSHTSIVEEGTSPVNDIDHPPSPRGDEGEPRSSRKSIHQLARVEYESIRQSEHCIRSELALCAVAS